MKALLWALFISGGFLSGSLLFCKIVPKLLTHRDVCELSDDGNPGAFNVFKHFGKRVGAICLLLDLLKGFIPVLLACFFTDTKSPLFAFVMIAPVLGHAVGMFNRFHGGKCIAVSFGVMAGTIPATWICFAILAALYVLFSTVVKITPNSKRSVAVFSLYGITSCIVLGVLGITPVALGCGIIAIIAIVKHLNVAGCLKALYAE